MTSKKRKRTKKRPHVWVVELWADTEFQPCTHNLHYTEASALVEVSRIKESFGYAYREMRVVKYVREKP